jgi:hypothetical protein
MDAPAVESDSVTVTGPENVPNAPGDMLGVDAVGKLKV